MAISNLSSLFLLLLATTVFRSSTAEIREMEIGSDGRSIIPFDEFGFTHNGVLELNVSGISFSSDPSDAGVDLSQLGFLLSTRDAWIHVPQQLQDLDITCALQSDLVHLVYSLDHLLPPSNTAGVANAPSSSFSARYALSSDPGQYTLFFANCLGPSLRLSMSVRSAMYNLAPDGSKVNA